MKLNSEWYLTNKMPKNATIDQRIAWHLEHLKNCQYRTGIPKKLKEEMRKRGMEL
ncbi:hypothetical protein [Maribacter aestuarii]|uniref:hypothetical protein n=1 Tax=Maribacter aestuarii TaxID=1130723 RepID=UPI00248CF34C|nr:hypothetical protein [Maribacter aestuarii]